jgi:DNA mismatch repair protein MutS
MDKCGVCGTPNSYRSYSLEAHHIKPQSEADEEGFIEHFHKNRAFNIVPLCHACHEKIHNERCVQIEGYAMTSEGRRLVVSTDRSGHDEYDEKKL